MTKLDELIHNWGSAPHDVNIQTNHFLTALEAIRDEIRGKAPVVADPVGGEAETAAQRFIMEGNVSLYIGNVVVHVKYPDEIANLLFQTRLRLIELLHSFASQQNAALVEERDSLQAKLDGANRLNAHLRAEVEMHMKDAERCNAELSSLRSQPSPPMGDEEIEADLRRAGIDVQPTIDKVKERIEQARQTTSDEKAAGSFASNPNYHAGFLAGCQHVRSQPVKVATDEELSRLGGKFSTYTEGRRAIYNLGRSDASPLGEIDRARKIERVETLKDVQAIAPNFTVKDFPVGILVPLSKIESMLAAARKELP